jgi:putative permease
MNRNQKIKLYLFLFFLGTTILFGILFPRLTLPFGVAYIIFLVSKPLTIRLTTGNSKERIRFLLFITIALSFLILPIATSIYNVDTDFSTFSIDISVAQRMLQSKFLNFKQEIFEKYGIQLNIDPVSFIISKLETFGTEILAQIPAFISTFFEWMLLVPLFLYFFFKESRNFSRKLLRSVPNPIFEKSYVLFSQFNSKFGDYINAKFIEATILGSLVTAGLLLVGFPYPFILGFVAGVTNILPYIGPVLGIIPALLIALLSKAQNVSIMGMLIIFGLANLIDMVLVFPLLVSKIVNLHPVVVVISIIIGSQLAGIVGMIIIIPFIAFFKLLFIEIYKDLSVHL